MRFGKREGYGVEGGEMDMARGWRREEGKRKGGRDEHVERWSKDEEGKKKGVTQGEETGV